MRLLVLGPEISFPTTCCCCNAPATTKVRSVREVSKTNVVVATIRKTIQLDLPACAECAGHLVDGGSRWGLAGGAWLVATMLGMAIEGALFWIVEKLAGPIAYKPGTISALLGIAVGVYAWVRLAPVTLSSKHKQPEAVGIGQLPFDPDPKVPAERAPIVLHLGNEVFAKAVLAANAGRVRVL